MFGHDLDSKALQSLEREMQRLFALGYRWSHIYTQCVLQAMLESFRYQLTLDEIISILDDDENILEAKVFMGPPEKPLLSDEDSEDEILSTQTSII
uniref:Uncharacterized protein n=1 Tax=Timema shepardi TaxID=629360 RepID=A0A7R9G237_TIMSH|nr:unnamed protein product [Timema shepardi]